MSGTYEYFLCYWGQVQNDNLIEKELGIKETNFWFETKEARKSFKDKLRSIADKHRVIIAFREEEGRDTRFRVVASMMLTLPDGRSAKYSRDCGFGSDVDGVRFLFTEGNQACDCNRSLNLQESGIDVEEFPCGDEIKVTDFVVELVP